MEDCERRIIIEMLEKCGWNQTEAAERFHVPLSTLNQKIKRLAIEIGRRTIENRPADRKIGHQVFMWPDGPIADDPMIHCLCYSS